MQAIHVSRSKQVQRDIAHYMAGHGARLTDAAERELAERLMMGDWNVRR
jgi:hypothetical protein